MAQPATRIGDADVVHDCQVPFRMKGSLNVFVNGIPWSRMGDVNTPHKWGSKCKNKHSMPIAIGSKTVFVNGRGAGRIGDYIVSCTVVATGSPNVFAGG